MPGFQLRDEVSHEGLDRPGGFLGHPFPDPDEPRFLASVNRTPMLLLTRLAVMEGRTLAIGAFRTKLGENFEIIAPDPAQPLAGTLGARIAAMPHPQLMQFALRSDDLGGVVAAARGVGLSVQDPLHMGRTRPDGVRLDWSILYLDDPRWPGFLPFVIDWKDSPHPSASAPGGCRLRDFVILHPDPQPLAEVYAALGVPIRTARASRPALQAVLDTPRGPLVLTGS